MSSKGRGSFLSLLEQTALSTESSSDALSGKSAKDSGLGSNSPLSLGEYRRLGRGKLIDELASSCSNLSLGGRGRSKFLEDTQSLTGSLSVAGGGGSSGGEGSSGGGGGSGRGRALLFQKLQQFETTGITTTSEEVELPDVQSHATTVTSEDKDTAETMRETDGSTFFKSVKNTHGSKGHPVRLACNYIRLHSDPDKGVFVYEVRFTPNVDSTNLRMRYLNEHRDKFGGVKTFDGVTLYLPILLPNKLTTYVSKSAADNSEIEIRVMFKRRETLKNCIHLYNVLFDRVMKTLHYVRFDRKQFDPTSPKIIPQQKLEVWPGYVTAVDEYEGGLMLCCDVSHRLLCQKTVLDMMIDIHRSNPNGFQEAVKKSLLGSVVITRYNNRTYRIDDICFDKNPLSTFPTKDGNISYFDYYVKHHNINIRDKQQPLLLSIKKQRHANSDQSEDIVFCLVPEICFLTGLRDEMRSDFRLMREIATFTRISPNQRLQALEKFYTNINKSPEATQILKDWGLSLTQSYETVNGRLFEEEKIYFAQKSFGAGANADFSKYATSNELLDVVNITNWVILHCKNDDRVVQSFLDHVEKCTRAFGMKVLKPKVVVLPNDRVDSFVNGLRENIKKETQIVVCISPTNREDRYSAIKKICCAEMPVPSQVINARTLSNDAKNRSIVQKIILQMNCKLGGSLWSVKIPFRKVMICGIDSYHDAAQKGNSVAAFVASLNETYSRWYSKAVIQTKREEIVSGLCSSFISALSAYHKENGVYPDNVIIYRDGVGDGQLSLCENYEIPQFEQASMKLLKQPIKITFIVTQKRINTRYFTANGNIQNPPPGTVVDMNITRSNYYDFFLVSQAVRQGTVSPTHYVVLRDDAAYSPDILQRLSYKLCFMYYNWPGTIRIPACCQYAHKMAYLVGQNIRRAPAEELSNKLFYL
ncbi:protein argonaute-3 [Musca vetustissima]|uniref:protein argonaute-3 n=1 Tax=Musca vetustissima TaxID=27455 RepID=UPI002AB60864|nr:protein argonaute-3 [Musca vetustissima]